MMDPVDLALEDRGREASEWHEKKIGHYHPSSLSRCLLSQYYSFKQPEAAAVDPKSRRAMWMGRVIHQAMESLFSRYGGIEVYASEKPVFHSLRPVYPNAVIKGKYDLLGVVNDELAVCDIKTRATLFYVDRDGPSEHDVNQLNFYLGATNMEVGYLIYVGRDYGNSVFCRVEFDAERFRWLVERAKILHCALIRNEPPDPNPSYGWEAKTCDYQAICPRFAVDDPPAQRLESRVEGRREK